MVRGRLGVRFGCLVCWRQKAMTMCSDRELIYKLESKEFVELLDKDVTEFTVPAGVTSIGDGAFEDCSSLSSLFIPASATSIGEGAFNGCSSLSSVAIPSSVTSIGDNSFVHCSSLTTIEVSENNPEYCSIVGALFTKDKKNLLAYPAGRNNEEYTIPVGVKRIGAGAFCGCSFLKFLEIPSGVTTFEDKAFSNCSSLKMLVIPTSVKRFGNRVFGDNPQLILRVFQHSRSERYARRNRIKYETIE